MAIVPATEFRKNMSQYVKQAQQDHKPLIVTTQKQGAVVVVSLEDWESLNETLYLTSTPANRDRLEAAVKNIRAEKSLKPHDTLA